MKSRIATMALSAALLGAPTAAFAAPAQPIAVQVEKTTAPAPAQHSDTAGYADREQTDKQVASYEGGSTVVIAMSGGAFVVLLLLLLIL
jgi:hypothetical protein